MRIGGQGIRAIFYAVLCVVLAAAPSLAVPSTPESLSKAEQMAAHQDSVMKSRKRGRVLMQLAGKEDDVRSLCSGVEKCLGTRYDFCTEADFKPWPKVKYDAEYCAPYHEIVKRGFPADLRQPMATEIFARLGRQYRAIYVNHGTLPLGADIISYLFDNMPFTAQLINAYLKSNYTLGYTSRNHRFFNGSNGRSLSGEFYWALQDSAGQKLGMRNLFFGYGHAKVLRWSLHGSAIAFLDMDEVSRSVPNGSFRVGEKEEGWRIMFPVPGHRDWTNSCHVVVHVHASPAQAREDLFNAVDNAMSNFGKTRREGAGFPGEICFTAESSRHLFFARDCLFVSVHDYGYGRERHARQLAHALDAQILEGNQKQP